MKVAIFGSTGLVGRNTLEKALQSGHQVSILVRNAKKVNIEHSNLNIVEGSVLNQDTVNDFLQGQEAVIQVLGYNGNPKKPTTFTTDATKVIINGMKYNGVKRLIAISVVGVGDSKHFKYTFFIRMVFPIMMRMLKNVIVDKNLMEPEIMATKLDWTIVRSSAVSDKPAKGDSTVTLDGKGLKLSVNVVNLADFIVNQITETRFIQKTPIISN